MPRPKVRPLHAVVYVEIDGEVFEVEFDPKEVDAIFFTTRSSGRWDKGGDARSDRAGLKDILAGKAPKGSKLSKQRFRKIDRNRVPKRAPPDDDSMSTVGAMAADDPPPPPNGEEGSLCWHEVNCTKWCLD